MSKFLHPNLLTTDQLREHLKKRFPTQNVSLLERNTLLQLFSSYAVPKSRRGTGLVIQHNDIEMKLANELNHEQHTNLNNNNNNNNNNKRPRHTLITAPSVETVTNACKKIRLVNSNGIQSTSNINNNPVAIISQKRQIDSQVDCVMSDQSQQMPSNTKRKKITWP